MTLCKDALDLVMFEMNTVVTSKADTCLYILSQVSDRTPSPILSVGMSGL